MSPSAIARLYFVLGVLAGMFLMYIIGEARAWKRARDRDRDTAARLAKEV